MIAIDDDHVAITCGIRSAFDGRIAWNWVRTWITFISVIKRHRHEWLSAGDDDVRNTERSAIPVRAKVRMQTGGRSNCGD